MGQTATNNEAKRSSLIAAVLKRTIVFNAKELYQRNLVHPLNDDSSTVVNINPHLSND
jgi:hypothetical protein